MKKIIKIILVLFVTLTLGACGSSEEKDTNKPTKTEEKKEEKIYTIGETVTYTKNSKDLIHFTVDSVRNTDDRNEFADSQPEQVIIIHYSYENIANEDDIYFSSINFKVIDEGGNVCETYPASINTYPQTAPIGTKSEGRGLYFKQQSSKIKLIVELDYSGKKLLMNYLFNKKEIHICNCIWIILLIIYKFYFFEFFNHFKECI